MNLLKNKRPFVILFGMNFFPLALESATLLLSVKEVSQKDTDGLVNLNLYFSDLFSLKKEVTSLFSP